MFFKVLVITAFSVGVIVCEPPVAPVYGVPPFNNGGNFNGGGGYNDGGLNDGGYDGGYNDGGYNGGNGGHGGNGVNEANGPVNGYNNGHDNGDGYGGEPKAYEFGYQVKDDYTGTNYNRQEQSDGNQVTGSYRVALPDGRTQIVTYHADWKTGFHADVRYEGEAQYPQGYNKNNNGYSNNDNGYPSGPNNNGYPSGPNNNGYPSGPNNNGYPSGPNNNGYPNNGNNNGYNNNPSNQYGPPVNPININNQYAAPSGDYGAPNSASSSVSIQDFSGPGTPYNAGNNYDSYSNGYNGNSKPNSGYGAP